MAAAISGGLNMLMLIFLLVSMAALCLGEEGGNHSCIESERKALLDIKSGFSHDARLSSWEGEDCCSWRGVGCDNSTGHVIKLDLARYPNCSWSDQTYQYVCDPRPSKLNPSLLAVKHLEYLDLSQNNFTGAPIPEFIGSLSNLKYLNLSDAGFGGAIPSQLGNLSSLQVLDLSCLYEYYNYKACHERVGYCPPTLRADDLRWLSGIPSLKHLDLSGVNLSKAGDQWIYQIFMLPSLSVLRLFHSGISTPIALPNFVTFPSITVIGLSYNDFPSSAIPHWLFGIRTLVELHMSDCNFGGDIPETLGDLHDLTVLDLSWNHLTGRIPESIGNLHNLNVLNLQGNKITGHLPDTIGKLHNLAKIDLSINRIMGQIPYTISNLTKLSFLNIRTNQISGFIPDTIGKLYNLAQIDLSDNRIMGQIPNTIGNLTKLSYLNIRNNQISGFISYTIGNLSKLSSLDLSHNFISGQMPKHIGSLAELMFLVLSNNQISGQIPVSMENLSRLEVLDLSYNNISGEIPIAMGSGLCGSISQLDLSQNNIRGTITDFVDGLSKCNNRSGPPYYDIFRLSMGSNKLTGTIPASLGQLSKLFYLDLSANSFVGALTPAHFANLTSLADFDLSHNQMNGELPATTWNKCFAFFDVSFNNFTGPIPNLNVSEARIINLSGNAFTGTIPSSFAIAPNLQVLSLSHNQVDGNIPDHVFCHKPSLEVLDLSHNQLSGRIPDCLKKPLQIPTPLVHLPCNLQSLHLSNNELHGEIPLFLKRCKNLIVLDLGENKLSGMLPTWIGESLLSLRILRLRSNHFDGIIPAQLSHLPALQVLDLGHNNLSGCLPSSFGNIRTMVSKQNFSRTLTKDDGESSYYKESIIIDMKGVEYEYTTVLYLVTSIDVSGNSLSGEIPTELSNLHELISLNLSENHFTGEIPSNIGALEQLESLDLSCNNLSGIIPPSLSALCFLSHLNLSNNNLSGRIPTGNQLSTLNDTSIYSNNLDLCGPPLPECLGEAPAPSPANSIHQHQGAEDVWLYASIVFGFVVGFWGITGTIMIRPSIRYAFFRNVDKLYDWFYVQKAISFNRLNAILANKSQGHL